MQELTGKEVEVLAEGIIYRGVLVEIGETEVYLRSESGWIVLPIEKVGEIRAAA